MNDISLAPMGFASLLRQSFQVLSSNLRVFVSLSAIAYAAIFAISMFTVHLIIPIPKTGSVDIVEYWDSMSVARKVIVIICSLAMVALIHRVYATAIIVVRELQTGRQIGVFQALRQVRRKHLRLFWLLFILSLIPPYIQGLILGLFFSPASPVAVVEDHGVRQSIVRSATLRRGGFGRIALLFFIYIVLVLIISTLIFSLTLATDLISSAVFICIWFIMALLIGQWYMTALTLNYFDQRRRLGEPFTILSGSELDHTFLDRPT